MKRLVQEINQWLLNTRVVNLMRSKISAWSQSVSPQTDYGGEGRIMDNWTNYHEDGYPMPLDVTVEEDHISYGGTIARDYIT